VEQAEANQIRFREVDQDGNPTDPEAIMRPDDQPDSGRGWSGRVSVNPFIVVLWVLSIALAGGGIWLYTNAFLIPGPMSGSGAMPLAFVLMNFAPWAVLGGTLAAMALLFWHAAQWQRRRQ
jgi:hypothetical protein